MCFLKDTHTHTHELDWAQFLPCICPELSSGFLLVEDLRSHDSLNSSHFFYTQQPPLFRALGWLMHIFEFATCAIKTQTKCTESTQNGQAVGQEVTGAI